MSKNRSAIIALRTKRISLILAAAGTLSASTIGNNLASRAIIDGCGGCYSSLNITLNPGDSVIDWSFFGDHSTGMNITPFLIDISSDVITGVGSTQTSTTNLQGPFAFGLVSGSAVIGVNTRFGWRDGTTSTSNGGTIDFDTTAGGPSTGTAGYWGYLNVEPSSFTTGTNLGNPENANSGRYYSVQVDTGVVGTPEPSAWILGGSILAGLGARRKLCGR